MNITHALAVGNQGSVITGCRFWLADISRPTNTTTGFGIANVRIQANNVLVERSLFRAPAAGTGRKNAIWVQGNRTRIEIRANVFAGTGVNIADGLFNIFANTFVGSRAFSPVILESMTAPMQAVIRHNLFAIKEDGAVPPVNFRTAPPGTPSNIVNNGYSRTGTMRMVMSGTSSFQQVGSGLNVELPKGYSNYSDSVPLNFRDYSLPQLRTDLTLSPADTAQFAKASVVFQNQPGNSIVGHIDTSIKSSQLFFPTPTFAPFNSGTSWKNTDGTPTNGIRVGALVNLDPNPTRPSPLAEIPGNLSFTPVAQNPAQIRANQVTLDPTYYGSVRNPTHYMFFYSANRATLASNDSAALKSDVGVGAFLRRSSDTGILTLPRQVRGNGSNAPVHVKLLHYNSAIGNGLGQAVVRDTGVVVASVTVPAYPQNDLSLVVNSNSTDHGAGTARVTVTKGVEDIDQARIRVRRETDTTAVVPSQVRALSGNAGASVNLTFSGIPRGTYVIDAVPLGAVPAGSGNVRAGAVTQAATSFPIAFQSNPSDTAFLNVRSPCTGAGTRGNPWCTLAEAMDDVRANGRRIIIITAGSGVIDAATIPANTGSAPVVIRPELESGIYPAQRPIFRGSSTASALVISRDSVTVQGCLFEVPTGGLSFPALVVASGAAAVKVESNLFRVATAGSPAATGLRIQGRADALHNIFWGFTSAIDARSSPRAQIAHNTFLRDQTFSGATYGLTTSSTADSIVVRYNFFSGHTTPYEPSSGRVTLSANVYTEEDPALPGGATETIRLDRGTGVRTPLDLTGSNYNALLLGDATNGQAALEECSEIVPCSPLYAGTHPSGLPQGQKDFFGRIRVNRPDVGAYEFRNVNGNTLGRLDLSIAPEANSSVARVTVTTKSVDSDDADSIYIWWSEQKTDKYATVPSAAKKSYPISGLMGANPTLTDTITGLLAQREYWVHAQLARATGRPVQPGRLGYDYSASYTPSSLRTMDSCPLPQDSVVTCPAEGSVVGKFIDSLAPVPFRNQFEAQIRFNTRPGEMGTGQVDAPRYVAPNDSTVASRIGRIVPAAGLPVIRLNVSTNGGLGTQGSNHSYQAVIERLTVISGALSNEHLFILPNTPGGLPTYVSSWHAENVGGRTRIVVNVDVNGPVDLVFGALEGAAAGGGGTVTAPATVFDHSTASDQSFDLTFQGQGSFLTANPLVLAMAVPAGGLTSRPVFSAQYPARGALATARQSFLHDSLRRERAWDYLKRVARNDSVSNDAVRWFPNEKKAFSFNAVDNATTLDGLLAGHPDLTVDGSGNVGSVTLPVRVLNTGAGFWKSVDNRAARGIELILTLFDGGKTKYARTYIRSRFANGDLALNDQVEMFSGSWNLYAYPWDEPEGGNPGRLVKAAALTSPKHKILEYSGNGEGSAGYKVINGGNFASARYDSGQAIWTANAEEPYKPSTDGGTTLDHGTFDLSLSAGRWHDIALPFNFPIKFKDVLDASALSSLNVWRFVPGAGPLPKNIPGQGRWQVPALNVTRDVMRPWEGYTLYASNAFTLKFPVLDSARSETVLPGKSAAKRVVAGAWETKLLASSSDATAEFLVGKAAAPYFEPEPPLVPGQNFRVGIKAAKPSPYPRWSVAYGPASEGVEGHWPLDVQPGRGFTGLSFKLAEGRGKVPLSLVETLERKVHVLGETPVSLGPSELESGDYHLVAGGPEYVESFLKGMSGGSYHLRLVNYPNPFAQRTSIRFALPASFSQVDYRLRVFDFQGRLVWDKAWRGGSTLQTAWDGRDQDGRQAPGGQYHLLVEAKAPDRPVFKARRKLIKLN